MKNEKNDLMEKIVSLCKRRGFIYPACEIYGGFANSYSYGPYGALLKKNIKDWWWKKFVETRADIIGLDGPVLLHPKVWQSSGHIGSFNDAFSDCKECKKRFRADHLIIEATGKDMEGDLSGMFEILKSKKIKCPECGASNWTKVKTMNMMFKTEVNGVSEPVYLRPETAGAIFVEFKNILDSMRIKIPFGVAQIGKAFRNEIVARNFIFRIREFEMMEIEYFFNPKEKWEPLFNSWLKQMDEFVLSLGVKRNEIRHYEHSKEKLSHYSQKTVDIEYKFPFGWSELYGLAHRSDFDLSAHSKFSKEKLEYKDPEMGRKYTPHVIEPTFGVDRSVLVALLSAYAEETVNEKSFLEKGVKSFATKAGRVGAETRIVLKFPPKIAPVKIAVFPLLKNKPKLVKKAKEIFNLLKNEYLCEFDDNGNIGKRYRRQDEIGTPYCVTVDFDTIEKNSAVTVRNRDSMVQERVNINELTEYFKEKF